MLFERFEVEGLAHYSYAVGCQAARCMAIVDPERNIDRYLDFARANDMSISHVLETHIHADYASGASELARRSGARHCVSAYDRGETFEIRTPHTDLEDGDVVELGRVRVVARHTPGHTPEHLAFVVFDGARSTDAPMLMLSGDFLFVGSLGRPDLLGDEAKLGLARRLHESVRALLRDLPDGIEIHPAHGAGSMCGAGMSGRPCSTLGYERLANPYLAPTLEADEFVERILATVPPFPPYYRRMKDLNGQGPAALPSPVSGEALSTDHFRSAIDAGHVVIDLRGQLAFGGAHIPGAFGIGAGAKLGMWAAWVVPPDVPILIVADHADEAEIAARSLARVGLDPVAGHLDGGIEAWREAGLPLRQTNLMSAREAQEETSRGGELRILDVRGDDEWNEGHPPQAIHIMGGFLADRLDEIPDRSAPIAVICESGYRSVVASSVLERAGYERVSDIVGGMAAWRAAGLPITAGGSHKISV